MNSVRLPSTAADVRFDRLGKHEWRVVDNTAGPGDPFGVLGFIESTGEFYEVTRIDRPADCVCCSSLDAAREMFVAS